MANEKPTNEALAGPLIEVRDLSMSYVSGNIWSRHRVRVQALDKVSLNIQQSETLAVVGESGSGKSTLARVLTLMERPQAGSLLMNHEDLAQATESRLRGLRSELQMIHQDVATSFNPRFTAVECVEEPLQIEGKHPASERRQQALHWMDQAGLPARFAERSPHELSRGQRQRLAIARALIRKPRLLVFDETLSGLDLLIKAQIVELLLDLRRNFSLTYLFISHDLGWVGNVADRIVVMQAGCIVEEQETRKLFTVPAHAHTKALIAAIPSLRPSSESGTLERQP